MSCKILVGNVPVEATEQSLQELFAPYGRVISIEIPKNGKGKPAGFAFVEMSSRQEAVNAHRSIADLDLSGRKLTVTLNKGEPDAPAAKFSWKKLFGS